MGPPKDVTWYCVLCPADVYLGKSSCIMASYPKARDASLLLHQFNYRAFSPPHGGPGLAVRAWVGLLGSALCADGNFNNQR